MTAAAPTCRPWRASCAATRGSSLLAPAITGRRPAAASTTVSRADDRSATLQPEMGHTGPTEFMRIAALAARHGITVAPHATIGAGIFLAASLHASAAVACLGLHEFQHSILRPNRDLLEGMPDCVDGAYRLPSGPGLGVRPGARVRRMIGLSA